ncbi:MAG: TlpA family protein disulfide reductase [Deltaproteobacteria bacterium]|nr:TlpA family protein disulfide reductase [Deltaproteobacteria bacterium]
MKRSWVALGLAVAILGGALALPGRSLALCLSTGQKAQDFQLEDINGKPVTLSSYKGKVVLLAFWASWCPRCMEELAFLQGLYTGHENDLVVLAINQETQNLSATHVAKLRDEISNLGIQYPILLDKNLEVWKSYCINALPTSIIVDREGTARFAEPNYYWASQKKIKGILSELGVVR